MKMYITVPQRRDGKWRVTYVFPTTGRRIVKIRDNAFLEDEISKHPAEDIHYVSRQKSVVRNLTAPIYAY